MVGPEPVGGARGWVDRLGVGLLVGPGVFVGAWVLGGARTEGYSFVGDAISRIAAVGAPERGVMTVGFVGYAVGVGVGALALRRALPGAAWVGAGVSALGTAGVALTPLDSSAGVDRAHGVAATVGYVGLAATPLLAAAPLRAAGRHRAAVASTATGVAIGAALVASSLVEDQVGLAQRVGLTIGDVWLAAAGVAITSRRRSL